MLNARPNHHAPNQPQPGSGAEGSGANPNRLNLLLSYAGWQHESWADRLPRLLEPMGVTSLRAGTGREATLVIDSFPIHMAVVDLSLPLDANPDPAGAPEAGPKLLEILRRLDQPPPTVVIKRARSHREDCREINAALRAGAFAVIDRPHTQTDLERLLEVLRRCLTRYYQGRWPGTLA
ncbi:MAG: response regulator [Phycisphaerales bacterium]|nr:response regulator [Phycisphaerales bacterium]